MQKKKKGLSGVGSKTKGFLARLGDHEDKTTKTKWIRTGTDIASSIGGGFLGSAIGKNAAWFGLGVLITGNFVNDRTGLYKTIGAGMLAYGIAKYFDNDAAAKAKSVQGFTLAGASEGVKERVMQFKDELLATFYLDRLFKKKTDDAGGAAGDDDGSVEGLDLSALDFFDDNNYQEANEYEISRQYQNEAQPEYAVNALPSSEEYSFAVINDLPDTSQL